MKKEERKESPVRKNRKTSGKNSAKRGRKTSPKPVKKGDTVSEWDKVVSREILDCFEEDENRQILVHRSSRQRNRRKSKKSFKPSTYWEV